LYCYGSKSYAQNGGSDDTDEDRLAAKFCGEAGSSKADDDGIIARKNEVDRDDLKQ
jgi:hypothetical protein